MDTIVWVFVSVVIVLMALGSYALLGRSKKREEKKVVEEAPHTLPETRVNSVRGENIVDIEGIGSIYAKKLNAIGIKTTVDLLEAGATRRGREEIVQKTGISSKLILEWVNLADLFRIKGIGEEYSDLLEEAGVDTVIELSKRNPDNLYSKIIEVNEQKHLVRRLPRLDEVKDWVKQARKLPRKVEY